MNREIFADGVSAVHITGQLVRIDLMTIQPHLKSDNSQPVVEVNQRLILPLDGFLQALSMQNNFVNQLIATGVL